MSTKSMTLLAAVAMGAHTMFAATYYAAPGVAIGAGSGTEQDPWNLYSALTGLDSSTVADELVLKEGTYDLSFIYPSDADIIQLTARTKNLAIRGETDDCTDVVIDGKGTKAFLRLGWPNNKSIATSLRNVTVTNCLAGATYRASVLSCPSTLSTLNVSNCAFYACKTLSESPSDGNRFVQGGAIYLQSGSVLDSCFVGCMVTNTLASQGSAYGGAISSVQGKGTTVRGCLFRDCRTYSTYSASGGPSGWTVCGAAGGGAIFEYSSSFVITNCHFDSCKAVGLNASSSAYSHAYGGAVCSTGGTVNDCFFTNCVATAKGGAANHHNVVGCTIVDCSAQELGAVGFGTYRIQNSLVKNCHGTSIATGEWNGGDLLDSVFRGNVVNDGSDQPFSIDGAATGTPVSGHVVSNCVFAGNGGKSIFKVGATARDLKFFDCIMVGNSTSGRAVIYVTTITQTYTEEKVVKTRPCGMYFRNCYFGPQAYESNSGALLDNAGLTLDAYVDFENCTFLQMYNKTIYSISKAPLARFRFKNCLFWDRANKCLPDGCASIATVTNCVFVQNSGTTGNAGAGANLDPQYGNRVIALNDLKLKGGDVKFDWNTTWETVRDYDWRPTKDSPFVNTCTNQFDVAWAQQCSRKHGPHDMGDCTWTEKPYKTVTIGKGTVWEKTYDTGVVWTRNNANPRRFNDYLDVGCFEYWQPAGMSLLFR